MLQGVATLWLASHYYGLLLEQIQSGFPTQYGHLWLQIKQGGDGQKARLEASKPVVDVTVGFTWWKPTSAIWLDKSWITALWLPVYEA